MTHQPAFTGLLTFTKEGDSLKGADGYLYLGRTLMSDMGTVDPDGDMTTALRLYNLPTVIAPGNWPGRDTASEQLAHMAALYGWS